MKTIPKIIAIASLLLGVTLTGCGGDKGAESEAARVELSAALAEIELLRQAGGNAEKAAALRKEAADSRAREADEEMLGKVRAMEPKAGPNRIYYFAFPSGDPDFGRALALFAERCEITGEEIVSMGGNSNSQYLPLSQTNYENVSRHSGYWVITKIAPPPPVGAAAPTTPR